MNIVENHWLFLERLLTAYQEHHCAGGNPAEMMSAILVAGLVFRREMQNGLDGRPMPTDQHDDFLGLVSREAHNHGAKHRAQSCLLP